MKDPRELAHEIVAGVVERAPLTDEDRIVLAEYIPQFLAAEDDLVEHFYDTLFAHPATAAVFRDGERAEREHDLRLWWRRTMSSGIGTDYLEWAAYLGLVHINRGVTIPMMMAAFQIVWDVAARAIMPGLSREDGVRFGIAISHFQSTAGAVMTEAAKMGHLTALENVAGIRQELADRLVALEIEAIEKEARTP